MSTRKQHLVFINCVLDVWKIGRQRTQWFASKISWHVSYCTVFITAIDWGHLYTQARSSQPRQIPTDFHPLDKPQKLKVVTTSTFQPQGGPRVPQIFENKNIKYLDVQTCKKKIYFCYFAHEKIKFQNTWSFLEAGRETHPRS